MKNNIIWNGRHFSTAFIDRVNSKRRKNIIAGQWNMNMVVQNKDGDYGDYRPDFSGRSFLQSLPKNAALTGTNVINNPFWWSADEFFLIIH
jgi:hypothetical protein